MSVGWRRSVAVAQACSSWSSHKERLSRSAKAALRTPTFLVEAARTKIINYLDLSTNINLLTVDVLCSLIRAAQAFIHPTMVSSNSMYSMKA